MVPLVILIQQLEKVLVIRVEGKDLVAIDMRQVILHNCQRCHPTGRRSLLTLYTTSVPNRSVGHTLSTCVAYCLYPSLVKRLSNE